MDYNSMKRKELQALCKKHNIPANSANSVLAEKLSKLLNEPEHEKLRTHRRTCMKSPVETTDEGEPRQAKKVRFSPNNDLVEYQLRSGRKQTPVATKSKARRKSLAMKVDKSVDDNNSIDDGVQAPSRRAIKGTNVNKEPKGNLSRVTRSKVHTLANDNAVQHDENKRRKKSVNDVKKTSESVEETVIGRVRVTRSKAHASIDDGTGPDVNPLVKKTRGRQVAKDVQNVEPSNELVDIPARVTRSRGLTVEDINKLVLNRQPEKKRTRKEMKATDQSSVAPEDKQEILKRKSLRTRGAKEIDEDQGDKAEVVNGSRATRSKAGLAVKSSGRNSKSKAVNKNVVQQLEEPLNNAGRKNVKQRDVAAEDKEELRKRKSLRTRGVENLEEDEGDKVEVVNGGRATRSKAHLAVKATGRNCKTKAENKLVVQQLEEPLKHAGRKNVNRRKSVMPPENSKLVLHLDKPVNHPNRNARGKSVLQKAQGKVISKSEIVESPTAGKKQSGQSMLKSVKVASDDEMKAANVSGSPKSRKRRGTPVIEDHTIGTEYVSPVDESARRSTRSASKSEGKSVANNQLESSVKTPTSRIRNQSALKGAFSEGNQRGTSQTLRSGATIRGDGSNKRAKLSVPKQSDSEYHAVKSTEEGTPVSKLVNFESGKEGVETEFTPAVNGSRRQVARSAIRSDKNEVGSILGKIDAREPTPITNKKQRNEDVQLSSGKPGKFRPNPAVNTAPVRVTRSGIKHRGNAPSNNSENVGKKKPALSVNKIQPLDDAQIPSPKVAEVGPSPDVNTIGAQSKVPTAVTGGILANLGDLQRLFSVAEVTETSSGAISDGSHVQNNVKSTMFSEVEVQEAVNVEKLVTNETESTETGSVSKRLQADVMVEESVASIGKKVAMEENDVDVFLGDADKKGDSSSYNIDSSVYVESFEQSDVKSKSKEDEGHAEPLNIEGVDGRNEVADNGVSNDVEDDIVAAHDSLAKQNVLSTAGKLKEDEGNEVEPSNIEGVDEGNEVAANCEGDNAKEDIDAAHDSLAEQNDLSTGENISYGLPIHRCDVADVVDDAGNELGKEPYFDVHKSHILSKSDDEHDSPILGIYDDEDGGVDATKGSHERVNANKDRMLQDRVLSDGDNEGVNTNNEHESNPKCLTDKDASDTSLLGEIDGFDTTKQPEPTSEPSFPNDIAQTPFSDNDISVVDRESHLKPQTGNDVSDIRLIGEYDVKGDTLNVPKELETGDREYSVDDKSDGQDGKSEYELLRSNDSPATDEKYVGGDDLEPNHTENMLAVTEVPLTSSDQEPAPESNIAIDKLTCYTTVVCDSVRPSDSSTSIEASPAPAASGNDVASVTVDALEESSLNIYKDAVSNIFGDIDGLGNTVEVTDTKNDSGNEQIIIETSEVNEGVWSKESASVSPDMRIELMTEEAKTTVEIDNTSTSDCGLDGGKFMDGCSNLGVDELDTELENSTREEMPSIVYSKECRLWGDLGAPITKESSPSTCEKEEFSNSPASAKEGDKNKQGPNTSAGLENYSFEMDEQKPVLADKSDIMDESVKDDRVSDVATSARGSSFIEESSSSAASLVDSVKNLNKASRNVTDGKPNLELELMKENSNPDITDEFFNWSESSLKSLFTTPATSAINHVKDGQGGVVNSANQDHYSSLKSLFTTPATTTTSHVKGSEADTTSHVKGSEANTISFAFSDNRRNEDIGINQSATRDLNHQWENEPLEVFNGEIRGNTTSSPDNEMHGVLSFEDFTNKLFEDEEVDGSSDGSSEKNKNFSDQYDFSGEAAGTGHTEAFGSIDNMINSDTFENKEETQLKGTKNGDD